MGSMILRAAALSAVVLGTTIASAQAPPEWEGFDGDVVPGALGMGALFGHAVTGLGDLDGFGAPGIAVGSPGRGSSFPGSVNAVGSAQFIWLDACGDYDDSTELTGQNLIDNGIIGSQATKFGRSLAFLGDAAGKDGPVKLVAVGAPDLDLDFSAQPDGAVLVYSVRADAGALTGSIVNEPLAFDGSANLKLLMGNPQLQGQTIKQYGWSVAGVGDIDGNGVGDLAVGDPQYGGIGRVWIHLMEVNASGHVRAASTHEIGAGLASGIFVPGELDAGDEFGSSLAGVGDVDGDEIPDLAVGVRHDDEVGPDWGDIWILFLNNDGTVRQKSRVGPKLQTPLKYLGHATAAAGDVDDNGVPDLLAANTVTEAVHTILLGYDMGASDLTVDGSQALSLANDCTGDCPAPGKAFGRDIAMMDDLDGNGTAELLVGVSESEYNNKPNVGSAWFRWDRGASPWMDLGNGLAGFHGIPELHACGYLQPGYPVTVELSGAITTPVMSLVIGLSALNAPLKGGVLVPALDAVIGIPSNVPGGFEFTVAWPPGVPPGTNIYLQVWLPDGAAPANFAASNAIKGTTP